MKRIRDENRDGKLIMKGEGDTEEQKKRGKIIDGSIREEYRRCK